MPKSAASFKKGQSGNPKGRPIGKTVRARFRDLVNPDLPAMVETLVGLAKGGDVQAIRVILERTIPSLKPTSDSLSLKVSGTLSEQGQAIVSAMTAGRITPDQSKAAMDTLLAQSHLVDQNEIITQLNEFSQWLQNSKK
jgi:hypothetical protein